METLQPIAAAAGFVAASYWLARLTKVYWSGPSTNARELKSLASFRLHRVLNGGFGGDFVALLGSFPWQKEGEQSIVVVKSANPVPECADDVLRVQLELQVESGAEFSYFKGRGNLQPWSCDVEVVSPASARLIKRYSQTPLKIAMESGEFYQQCVLPWLEETDSMGKAINWVIEVLEGRKEANRCLANDDEFLVGIDTKWQNHPNADVVPRSEWATRIVPDQLYCLGITKLSIPDLRHLRVEHLGMLERMREKALAAIQEIYGVPPSCIRCFVHYPPQFYRLHVHFVHVSNMVSQTSSVPKAWSLQTVIECLESDSLFFANATMEVLYREGETRPTEEEQAAASS